MNSSSDFGRSSQSAFDHPHFLPLDGASALQAVDCLMRKGSLLSPPLTRVQALSIAAFMSLEHFPPGSMISFDARDMDTGRMMLVLSGEANIRMRGVSPSTAASQYSPLDRTLAKWFNVGEGSTLGLIHAFSGLSSRFVGQAVTELFVASLTRAAYHSMKQQEPVLALRYTEMVALEVALVALDHEKNILALSQVARSMQNHIDEETGQTKPAPLFGIP
jgi:hypothetical protein